MGDHTLIATEHALTRVALGVIVKLESQCTQIYEAATLEAAERLMTPLIKLLILDEILLSCKKRYSLCEFVERSPTARTIILTNEDDRERIINALRFAPHGVVAKSAPYEEIRFALRRVIGGAVYVPPSITTLSEPNGVGDRSSDPLSKKGIGLTSRQLQVMQLVSTGFSNKEIARSLAISEGTAKVHVRRSLRKMDVVSRFDAAQKINTRN